MQVTKIKIYPLSGNRHILALADIIVDDCFAISDLRIAPRKSGGCCVLYPVSQQSSAVAVRHICNPITKETQEMIEDAVLKAYAAALKGKEETT